MANAIVIYRGKPKGNSWARWMIYRTQRLNKNNLISIVGKTGSGKTWSAISICEIMSKIDGIPFTINHIVFSLRELMELINSDEVKKSSKGVKIVFDEPQVSISAREFQSEANKVFNYLLSTFRHKNISLFFCTPFETLLDKNTRKLFHAKFETMSINKNNKTCRLKPRYVEYSDFKQNPYVKQMIVIFKDEHGNTKTKKLFYWDVPKPSEDLIIQYEKKKTEFTNLLNKNISERLRKYDEQGKSITSGESNIVKKRKPLTPAQEKVMRVFANIKESNKYVIAREKLGVSFNAIYQSLTLAKDKGYTLDEFKEKEAENGGIS